MNLTFGVPGLLGGIKFAPIKRGEQKVKKFQSKIDATTWRKRIAQSNFCSLEK